MADPRDTVAPVDWEAYERDATASLEGASTSEEVEGVSVSYLGRRSELKQALREVRDRETGMTLNAVREAIESALAAKLATVQAEELERRLTEERVDVTLPAELLGPIKPRRRGSLHPSTQVRRDVEDIFLGLGYEIVDGREVETTRYNFDALGFPDWHPSRSPRASLYVTDDTVLRTETSPAQIHKMEEHRPPIYMLSIGRVYRRDTIDATHFPIFHQFEGLAIDKGITMADLKGTLLYVMRQLYGPDREVRFRTHYFPFTEPSMEPDVSCMVCARRRLPRSASSPAGSRWAAREWSTRISTSSSAGAPRSTPASRSGWASSARRSCATASPASARSGRTTSAS